MNIAANNEFETIVAFTHVAGCSLSTWSKREVIYSMIRALETAGSAGAGLIAHKDYKELAKVSDEDLLETSDDWEQELAEHLNYYIPMPAYCSVSLQDGEWKVLPYIDDELERFKDTPEKYVDDCVLVVNDHGNVTCVEWNPSDKEYQPIWDMV